MRAQSSLITWTLEAPTTEWLLEHGYRELYYDEFLTRFMRPALDARATRSTIQSPFAGLLARFDEARAVAVRDVRTETIEDLRAIYGGLMEPAYRRGCRLLLHVDRDPTTLDPAQFVEPGFGYAWTLERIRYLLSRPRSVARADAGAPGTALRLDESQLRAVRAHDGVVQVIAPAGSGKTTVLVERVRELLRRGVAPERILCVTFNRDAANELRERLGRAGVQNVRAQTFNSIGYEFLRTEGLLRHPETWTPSHGQWRRLSHEAQRAAGEGGVWIDPPVAKARIDQIKLGMLMTPGEWAAVAPGDPESQTVLKLYELYERLLAENERNDFADQVMLTVRRLREDADVRKRWQARYEHVLVDEYQDIEPAQELLVQILAAPQDGLFTVGDEDQTLYSWRRANVERILGLDQLYPGLERVSLRFNYRCPREVVEGSRRLVERNRRRFPKQIESPRAPAAGTLVHRSYQSLERAAVDVVKRLAVSERGQVVVLARTTRLLRTVAKACVEADVKISAPPAVFEPRGARGALQAYLRLFTDADTATAEDVRTVFRVPSRGLPFGQETAVLEGLRAGRSFGEIAAAMPANDWQRRRLDAAASFLDSLRSIRDAGQFIRILRGPGGLDQHFEESDALAGGTEAIELEELDDAEREASGKTVLEYARTLARTSEALQRIRDDEHGIELTTVHRAKGREWPLVIIFGADERQLPHQLTLEEQGRSAGDDDGLESERRVAYVAMTRASERLVLLSTEGRHSRFLEEAGVVKPRTRRAEQRRSGQATVRAASVARRPRRTDDQKKPMPAFAENRRIRHPMFGEGTIVRYSPQKMLVDFGGVMHVITPSRRLTIVD